jgi:hypothetical protein
MLLEHLQQRPVNKGPQFRFRGGAEIFGAEIEQLTPAGARKTKARYSPASCSPRMSCAARQRANQSRTVIQLLNYTMRANQSRTELGMEQVPERGTGGLMFLSRLGAVRWV